MISKVMAAISRRLSRLSDSELEAVGRRAKISARQMRRLRSGSIADIKMSKFFQLADALRVTPAELGGSSPQPKRPAPIGRKRGRPRNIRRQPDVCVVLLFRDEDEEEQEV